MELKKKKGYHRHHIIPKHMGGDDSKENLVYLTPEEHALAHLELYEKYGKYEDAQAFNTLSSQWLNGRSIGGYKQSEEHISKKIASTDYEQVSRTLKDRYEKQPHHSLGRKNGPPSKETKDKISKSTKGKKKDNSREKMGQYWKGKPSPASKQLYCIGCQKQVSPSRIMRHDKCFKMHFNLVK